MVLLSFPILFWGNVESTKLNLFKLSILNKSKVIQIIELFIYLIYIFHIFKMSTLYI